MRRFVKHVAKKYESIVNVKDFGLIITAYALKIVSVLTGSNKLSKAIHRVSVRAMGL